MYKILWSDFRKSLRYQYLFQV